MTKMKWPTKKTLIIRQEVPDVDNTFTEKISTHACSSLVLKEFTFVSTCVVTRAKFDKFININM